MWSFKKVLIVLLLLTGCNTQHDTNNYSNAELQRYQLDFLLKYKDYKYIDNYCQNDGFLDYYKGFCNINTGEKNVTYFPLQSLQIYLTSNKLYKTTFEYQLVRFKDANKLNAFIIALKMHNCIDENSLMIHRIYLLGNCIVILVNFHNFNINDYECFLKKEFGNNITKETINISR